MRLKRGERIVPLVIDRKLSQAQDDERTVPLVKGQKVLQARGCERTVPLAYDGEVLQPLTHNGQVLQVPSLYPQNRDRRPRA